MAQSKTYSKKEISEILFKASEIQTTKDIYGEEEGLTEEELIHIAADVGISKASITEALSKLNEPDLNEQSYHFVQGTSRIQDVSTVPGEFTDEQWEEVVLEIRKITGGIGKAQKVGNTFEWEQRKSDFGYKHFSFTPKKGQTKLQMVSSWGPFKKLAGFLSFFIAFVIALVAVKEISSKQLALLIAPFAGLGGFAMSRFFLRSYFNTQKQQLAVLTAALGKKIISFEGSSGSIKMEDQGVYQPSKNNEAESTSNKTT
jgi:hypothetical protein